MTAEPIPCPCGCEIPAPEAERDGAVTCPRCGRVIAPGENRRPIASILQRIQDINTNRVAVDDEPGEDEAGLTDFAVELLGLCFPRKHISLWTWLRVAWIVCALHGMLALMVLGVVLAWGPGPSPQPDPRQIPTVRDAFVALGKCGLGAAACVMAMLATWRVVRPRRLMLLERFYFVATSGVSLVTLVVLVRSLHFATKLDHLVYRVCLFCLTLTGAVALQWAVKRRGKRYGLRSRGQH